MKFIRKHTEGPWHSLSDPIKEKTMDAMLDYLIERAEKLNYWIENKQLIRNGSREELTSIIEIIKAAGVEVLS